MNKKQKERAEIELQLSRVLQTPSERGVRSRGLLDDYRSPTRLATQEPHLSLSTDTEDVPHTIIVPHTFTTSRPVQNVPDTENVPLPEKSPKKGF